MHLKNYIFFRRFSAIIFCLSVCTGEASAQIGRYLDLETFLSQSFTESCDPAQLWVTGALKQDAEAILKHPLAGLSQTFWHKKGRTVWVIDERGYQRNITVGVVIEDSEIRRLEVLEYREPRGAEVRHDYFTRQFIGVGLTHKLELSDSIDGISGATHSVSAVSRAARLALLFEEHLAKQAPASP